MAADAKCSSILEIPMVANLGIDAPIPEALRRRLSDDLEIVQGIADHIRDIINLESFDNGASAHLAAIDSMAYRIICMLDHWTGVGYLLGENHVEVDHA